MSKESSKFNSENPKNNNSSDELQNENVVKEEIKPIIK